MNLKKMERYLRVNLLGPGPRLIKKEFTGRGLTKVEKHCPRDLHFFDTGGLLQRGEFRAM